jgi:hypothetical protein
VRSKSLIEKFSIIEKFMRVTNLRKTKKNLDEVASEPLISYVCLCSQEHKFINDSSRVEKRLFHGRIQIDRDELFRHHQKKNNRTLSRPVMRRLVFPSSFNAL